MPNAESFVKNMESYVLCIIQFLILVIAEGKIAPDEPAVLPPLPLVPKSEKRKVLYGTPQSKRIDYKDRDWDRERDRDFELMPPPGSIKKDFASPVELDQPIDPNEPTYCVCHQVSFGDMIACDNENG
ncbi:UNVERIFIED_CONTAM: PHD finger protein ING2 [Sesamum latifolium]|uniref:PHD finger protein ING2 n=1 Tax=Sesamum latifolium TaxID=2727402 RepID=A0AAW2Y481_9LAMI